MRRWLGLGGARRSEVPASRAPAHLGRRHTNRGCRRGGATGVRPASSRPRFATPTRYWCSAGPITAGTSTSFELAEQGWAPSLVISNPAGDDDRWLSGQCAESRRNFTVHCFTPDPATTKGEGRELQRLASLYRWRTVIIVTIRPHISRARFILARCFDAEFVMVPSPGNISVLYWAYQYLYQTTGYVRALIQPGC
jgi:hypothetical protein